jgi:hypothetical protein
VLVIVVLPSLADETDGSAVIHRMVGAGVGFSTSIGRSVVVVDSGHNVEARISAPTV